MLINEDLLDVRKYKNGKWKGEMEEDYFLELTQFIMTKDGYIQKQTGLRRAALNANDMDEYRKIVVEMLARDLQSNGEFL